MSDIIIEEKNLRDINQTNFQSVGPYTNPNETQVKEPWQGRYKLSGSEDTDLRFDLGTYTENDRNHWEIQTVDSRTRRSQFQSKDLRTARADVKNNLVIPDEVNWSVDTFPFVLNTDNNETVPLYFYYDRDLHPSEYKAAVNGKINLRIELREDGRYSNGIIDNFLSREPYRPFFLGLGINNYGTDADGILTGEGAFFNGDYVQINANPNSISYFEKWTRSDDGSGLSTNSTYSFNMPQGDIEVIGNFRPNPIIRMTTTLNGGVDESAGKVWFGRPDLTNQLQSYPLAQSPLTNTMTNARRIHNFFRESLPALELGSIEEVIPDGGTSNLGIGTTRGYDDVFILTDSIVDQQESDQDYTVYEYEWGANIQNLEKPEYAILRAQKNITSSFLETNRIQPSNDIKLYTEPSGQAYVFDKYTYLDINGVQQDIEPLDLPESEAEELFNLATIAAPVGEITFEVPLDYTGPKSVYTILPQPDYPEGVLQIYANYIVGTYGIRNFNAWKDSTDQTLLHRLRYGYGQVTINGESIPTTQEFELGTAVLFDANTSDVGYEKGDFFWIQDFASPTIPFDQNILDTSVAGGPTFISETFTPGSDQVEQIILTQDNLTYIGHKFKQEGVYVKVSKAEDSADFSINLQDLSFDTPEIIRQASNSEEVGVDMWEVNGGDISWLISYNSSNSGQPLVQSVTYFSSNGNLITSHPNSLPSGLDVELIPLSNNNQLNYTTPNSIDSDNYYRYIDIKLFSEILSPFRTIEINIVPPNRYLTNWDQEAVDSDADINLFTDDSLIENDPSSDDNQDSTIVVPEEFFNGTRELKIKVQANSNFDVENPIVSISQISGPTQPNVGFSIDEVDDTTYIVSITNTDRSFEISLDWDEGGV